jgi:hypothetical protein
VLEWRDVKARPLALKLAQGSGPDSGGFLSSAMCVGFGFGGNTLAVWDIPAAIVV